MWFNSLKQKIDYIKKYATIMNGYPTLGNVYFVFNSSNTYYSQFSKLANLTYEDWTSPIQTSLTTAISQCTSGRNDIIALDGNSSHALAAWEALTKSRINFIGMDGWWRLVQQWAKIVSTDWAWDAYVMKNTWTRNSFRNIKFIQQDTDAAALTVFQEWWEWTVFENCSFTFWVVDNLWGTTTYEFVAWSDSATYRECLFGTETLLTSDARTVFLIDQVTASQEFKSNILKDCNFLISSSSATASLVKVAANTDVLFTNLFDNCNFMASVDSAWWAALTNACTSAASLVKWTINFKNPWVFNCTNFSASDSTAFKVAAPAASNNAFESVTPA